MVESRGIFDKTALRQVSKNTGLIWMAAEVGSCFGRRLWLIGYGVKQGVMDASGLSATLQDNNSKFQLSNNPMMDKATDFFD